MKQFLLTSVLCGVAVAAPAQEAPPKQPDTVDILRGSELYAQSCASCHGAELEGQANWQSPGPDGKRPAPPHDETGHTWHHGDALLFNYTMLGGQKALEQSGIFDFNSGMPEFASTMSEQDVWDVLAYIKSTWPDRIQELQAVRSEAEQLRGN